MASSAEKVGVRAQDLAAVRRAQRSFHSRWPRGPRVDMAQEAETSVGRVVGERRPRVAKPQWIPLPPPVGLRPLDQSLTSPLPRDRPLRILELFAGVGTGIQALVRLGYGIGEVIACEARGAARVVHAHAVSELVKDFPGVNMRAGA
jgi:hypothetical protein